MKTFTTPAGGLTWLLAALLLLLSLSSFKVAAASVLAGKVIGMLDGDTIDVLDTSKVPHRIRLTGIYATWRC